jgi:hypothetical protein
MINNRPPAAFNISLPGDGFSTGMTWGLEIDQQDAFFPATFDDPPFAALDSQPSFFDPLPDTFPADYAVPSRPSIGPVAFPLGADGQSLVDQNAELRQTAMSLKERFAQMASLNEHLKTQLDDCRSRFRSAVFSGFSHRK